MVGARAIAFNQPRGQTFDIFGYPAEDANTFLLPPNFDGQKPFSCHSPQTADDDPAPGRPRHDGDRLRHDRRLERRRLGRRGGVVESVTSYGYQLDSGHLYGPYFGDAAEDLYERAGGAELLCAGKAVTNLGGSGADAFTGTEARELVPARRRR